MAFLVNLSHSPPLYRYMKTSVNWEYFIFWTSTLALKEVWLLQSQRDGDLAGSMWKREDVTASPPWQTIVESVVLKGAGSYWLLSEKHLQEDGMWYKLRVNFNWKTWWWNCIEMLSNLKNQNCGLWSLFSQ